MQLRVLMERMGGSVRFAHAEGGGFAAAEMASRWPP